MRAQSGGRRTPQAGDFGSGGARGYARHGLARGAARGSAGRGEPTVASGGPGVHRPTVGRRVGVARRFCRRGSLSKGRLAGPVRARTPTPMPAEPMVHGQTPRVEHDGRRGEPTWDLFHGQPEEAGKRKRQRHTKTCARGGAGPKKLGRRPNYDITREPRLPASVARHPRWRFAPNTRRTPPEEPE